MKAALISRSSMYSVKGGDTIQLLKTAEGLNKLGISTKVFQASEKIPYSEFDILHFFNVIRPADQLRHIKESGKPYVVSTIYLDYSSFDKKGRGFPYRHLFRILGRHRSEYFKNIYRFLSGQDSLVSRSYLLGHRKSMLGVLEGAALILPNSSSEYLRLQSEFGRAFNHHVVPNGIDPKVFGQIPEGIRREKKVISVAQIYGMKNQHMLIQACNELKYPLEIIGKPPPNHTAYYNYCKSIAGPDVSFVDFMPQEELVMRYASAEVHALPSWFETTGLTSLEAGTMGCKLVVGKDGDTLEYFGDMAWFCDPDDQDSIKSALRAAMDSTEESASREHIMKKYTWDRAAEETLKAYKQVLHE